MPRLNNKNEEAKPTWIEKVGDLLPNKYVITILIFGALLIFTEGNNIILRVKTQREIIRLEHDIKELYLEIEEDKRRMNELQSNKENLEKFAREQYLMKRKNEDIYIINE